MGPPMQKGDEEDFSEVIPLMQVPGVCQCREANADPVTYSG